MTVRDILWETEGFNPNQPVWWIEGTGYNEDDCIITVRYKIPADVRKKTIAAGRVTNLAEIFKYKEEDLIRSDR